MSIVHILNKLLFMLLAYVNNFGCPIANLYCPHCVLTYRPNVDTCLCQNTANCNICFTCFGIYVPEANMADKLHIYAISEKYLTCTNGRCLCIYVPHMKTLVSTMLTGMLYTNVCSNDNTSNNIDDNFQLLRLHWSIDHIRQRHCFKFRYVLICQNIIINSVINLFRQTFALNSIIY